MPGLILARHRTVQPQPQQLDQLVSAIVRTVQPLRIILFGSAARGPILPGSDVDLLVVMPDGTHRRRTAQQLYRSLRGAGVPFDLVVATEADLVQHGANPSLIYRAALQEGRTLYAA